MTKEMMIVFVYDTLRCLAEADDPADALLYFHPGWVSDSQRIALCGQLMGVTHCLKALFSTPKILSLHSGKFVIKEYGRFILAIGSDRNIPDWVLKKRADVLISLIKIYHCDLQTIAAQFPGENNPHFSEKLYQMFETYIPILIHSSKVIDGIPLLDLPKSATNVFMESMQILEHCQTKKGVLGGVLLCNNKIVASQLNPKLTSHLAMVDLSLVKSPAETVDINFQLPTGAQLIVIYVRKKHFETLNKEADKMRMWRESGFIKSKFQKANKFSIKEPSLGSMKRDKSLLFTAVPEEDIATISPSPITSPNENDKSNSAIKSSKESTEKKISIPDVVPFSNKPRVRPNKLPLSFKNSVSKTDTKEEDIIPNTERMFTGQTSVCSTPLLEYKRLHGNVMSICRTSDDKTFSEALNSSSSIDKNAVNPNSTNMDIALRDLSRKCDFPEIKEPSNNMKVVNEHFISPYIENSKRSKSLNNVNDGIDTIFRNIYMRFGKNKIRSINTSVNGDDSPTEDIEDLKVNMTITDPFYPVFRSDGVPISKILFDEYLHQHYPDKSKQNIDKSKCIKSLKIESISSDYIEGFDSNVSASPLRRKSYDVTAMKQFKIDSDKSNQMRRKSLTLPLKPLGSDKNAPTSGADSEQQSLFESSRKKLTGVQLTPLMEKLSHLVFSEKSSGYSSRGITPMEFKDFALSTPCLEKPISFPSETKSTKKSIPTSVSDSDSESDDDVNISSFSIDCIKCTLFVYGYQSMEVMLMMEEFAAKDSETVHSIWENSVKMLGSIEQLCMEPLPSGNGTSDAYSFLTVDSYWGPLKKGGPWAPNDLETALYIQKDFKQNPTLTEMIVRSEDSLVYGTTCGGSGIYYQENGSKQPGLPTPVDLMGTAPLKSKRRLQRDHSIIIF